MIDKNMNKLDALESRNDNINSKLNNNISDINDLLKEINDKLMSGSLDQDERFVYELQLQEINASVSTINKKVEVVNVVESKQSNDKINEKMDEDENIDQLRQQVS